MYDPKRHKGPATPLGRVDHNVGGSQLVQPSARGVRALLGGSSRRLSTMRRLLMGVAATPMVAGLSPQLSQTPLLDPRPLRDRQFQAQLQEQVWEYLAHTGYEVAMNKPLTRDTLRNPGQRDFMLIFQFLYLRVDPGHQYTKSVDAEMHPLLRGLGYPYIDLINRSAISAVGGNKWHVFLGMLHWMVRLCQRIDGASEAPAVEILLEDAAAVSAQADQALESIRYTFLAQAYASFLAGNEQYTLFQNEGKQAVHRLAEQIQLGVDKLTAHNDSLLDQFRTIQHNLDLLQKLAAKRTAYETDVKALQVYNQRLAERKPAWEPKLQHLRAEITAAEVQVLQCESDKRDVDRQLLQRGLDPQAIDRLIADRTKITRTLEAVGERLAALRQVLEEQDKKCSVLFNLLEATLKKYNQQVWRIDLAAGASLVSVTLPPELFELQFSLRVGTNGFIGVQNLVADGRGGVPIGQVLNQDLKREKTKLLDYRKAIQTAKTQHLYEVSLLKEQLQAVKDDIEEATNLVEDKESERALARDELDELNQQTGSFVARMAAEEEELGRECRTLKSDTSSDLAQANQLLQRVQMEWDKTVRAVNQQREELHWQVMEVIEWCTQFKMDVKQQLDVVEKEVKAP